MSQPIRIALAGAGAFGEKHLDGLKNIPGVEITSIISRTAEQAAAVAAKYGAKHCSTELDDALARARALEDAKRTAPVTSRTVKP